MLKKLLSKLFGSSVTLPSQGLPPESEAALRKLMEGNARYVQDRLEHPNRSMKHLSGLVEAQTPFAVIVGCSDSRAPPVIIFDQGVGDLFEVRTAGNVVGPIEAASVEFAAKYLGASLIFVIGHENCGAVQAVLAGKRADIEPVADKIEEAIMGLHDKNIENAVKANVHAVVNQLRNNPAIAKLITDKKVYVTGGYYILSNGKVELIS